MSDPGLRRSRFRRFITGAAAAFLLTVIGLAAAGCETVNDERIPAYPVYINISNQGLWNSFGVTGFGEARYFVLQEGSPREPAGFSYVSTSATGFGGVLLVGGMDPFTMQTGVPLAYDMACPVERAQNVRVRIDPKTFEAVCPVCDSHYDVTMAAGAPTAGDALVMKYGLRRYYCHPTTLQGYIINDIP